MRKQVTILFFCLVILSSCDSYHDSPTTVADVQELNNKLEAARLNNDDWTNLPVDIARHLFPAVSHDTGPKQYEITKKSTSKKTCLVTVFEEGPIDDEVLGERRIIEFQDLGGKWNIVDYQYAVKRRESPSGLLYKYRNF